MDDPVALVEVDGFLIMLWPEPRPPVVEITAEVLDILVELVNDARHPRGFA